MGCELGVAGDDQWKAVGGDYIFIRKEVGLCGFAAPVMGVRGSAYRSLRSENPPTMEERLPEA